MISDSELLGWLQDLHEGAAEAWADADTGAAVFDEDTRHNIRAMTADLLTMFEFARAEAKERRTFKPERDPGPSQEQRL